MSAACTRGRCCIQVADDTDDQDEQQAVKPVAEAAAAAAETARGLLSIALVPKPLQLGMPIMYGAEQAEPGLAAGVMQQLQQHEQQLQAMQQQQVGKICAGCVKSSTIWGQLFD
jgi:uncharacterized protein HemX